jgi:hypothetical protein
MVIKSFNKKTGETIGDCSHRFDLSWELHQDGDTFIFKIDGQPDEILEWSDNAVYYYISKKKKKKLKLLMCTQLKHWMYTQWQSGDVWDYAPYLTKLERDMLVYGNAQWTQLNYGEDDNRPDWYL